MVGIGGLGDKGDVIKYKMTVTNSHRDIRYSIGDTVNNIAMTLYGAEWVLDDWGSLHKIYEYLTTMLYN